MASSLLFKGPRLDRPYEYCLPVMRFRIPQARNSGVEAYQCRRSNRRSNATTEAVFVQISTSLAVFAVFAILLLSLDISFRSGVSLTGHFRWGLLNTALLQASINMAKISVGLDDVADAIFQFFRFWETSVVFAVPYHRVCNTGWCFVCWRR